MRANADDQVLRTMLDRAHGLWRVRKVAESLGAFEEALQYAEREHGEAAAELVEPLTELCGLTLAVACNLQDGGPDPLPFGERALRIAEREGGSTDPRYARLNQILGSAYLARGRYEEALDYLQVALRGAQSADADWFRLGGILENIVETLGRMGRYAEAVPFAEARLRSEEKGAPADSITLVVAEFQLGRTLLGAQDHARAVEHIERALELCRERKPGPSRLKTELLELLQEARTDPVRVTRTPRSAG